MDLTIGFGSAPQTVTVPDANLLGVLTPNTVEITSSGQPEVVRALNEPIGTKKLKKAEDIRIVLTDFFGFSDPCCSRFISRKATSISPMPIHCSRVVPS